MSTQLAKQISIRMKARNLSVASLEKEAGLKTHAVRNILRGKSKKPSAEILQAVSDVLGCSVKDLLEDQDLFSEEQNDFIADSEFLNENYEYPKLLLETTQFVNDYISENQYEFTNQQVIKSIEEIFLYSLKKDPRKVDQTYGRWFLDLGSH